MKTYAKGYRFEAELLHFLHGKGFSVIRGPSSGGDLSPVDVVAMKRGLVLAFECKNWEKKPKLTSDKIKKMKEWCETAGALGFLTWRNNNQWIFLRLEDAEENRYDDENWFPLENLLKAVDFR